MIQLNTRSLVFLALLILCKSLNAQEWKYEGPVDSRSWASDSWIDENGNSYHNITKGKISKENRGSLVSKHLLILDKNGRFNGVVKVQSCNNRALILPFSEGNFLVNGHNCDKEFFARPDSRVLDRKGNLLLQGEGFAFHNISSYVRTKNGYTVFSKNGIHSTNPTVEIRDINWDFSSSSQMLDLSKLIIPNMLPGIDGLRQPIKGQDGRWLILGHQGVRNSSGGRHTMWDFVFLTDGRKIFRHFPKKRDDFRVQDMRAYKDGYAVISYFKIKEQNALGMTVSVLDKNAKLVKSITLDQTGSVDKFLILNEQIFILNSIYDRDTKSKKYMLQTFDMDGNLVFERLLFEHGPGGQVWTMSMLPFGNHSILLSGSALPSKKERTAFIWKLDIGQHANLEEEDEIYVDNDTFRSPIQDLTIEDLDEDIISVAVFPNPASIYINFEIDKNDSDLGRYHLDVFSVNGRRIRQANFGEKTYELDIADLPSGTYTYRIYNLANNQEYFTGKFIKME